MMKERLMLAKKLMAKEGIIFVSIDDNEQAYLKVLMDEIFGEENFIANINWQSSFGGKNDTKLMPVNTEYILFYGNQTQSLIKLKDTSSNKSFSHEDKYSSLYGKYKLTPLCRASLTYYLKLDYIIYVSKTADNNWTISNQPGPHNIGRIVAGSSKWSDEKKWQARSERQSGQHNDNDWRFYWSWPVVYQAFKAGFIEIKKQNNSFHLYAKEYEKAKFNGRRKKIELRDYKKIALRNIISDPKISNKTGNQEILSIFSKLPFKYPKPTSLIQKIIRTKAKNAWILDFFAGTGTTAQAVMNLNRQDNGNRKFILVTNDENNIDQICYERLYRIIKDQGTKGEVNFDWLQNNTPYNDSILKVFSIKHADIGFACYKDQDFNFFNNSLIQTITNSWKIFNTAYNKPADEETLIKHLLQLTYNEKAENKEN